MNPPNAPESYPQERAERVVALLIATFIPPRFASTELAACLHHHQWRDSFMALVAKLSTRKDGFIICLCGSRGTGKTRMATEAIRAVITRHLTSATYGQLEDYLQIVRRADHDTLDLYNRWLFPKILVVDEIAKSGDAAWVEYRLFHLVSTRYNDLKHSVLICAAPPDHLPGILGPSVYDRINEGGLIIHCDWPSLRSNQI